VPDRLAARAGLGRRAEGMAAAFLEGQGFRIVARNWRQYGADAGELDLVADDHGTCVFVEVRSRTGEAQGHPLETVTAQKRARVIRAARLYLAAEAPSADGYRFDVVAVTFWEDERPPEIVHVPNAFELGTSGAG
jgi:putative endonuclease